MHVNSMGYNSVIDRHSVEKTFPYFKDLRATLPIAQPRNAIQFVNEESKVEAVCNLLEKEAQTNDSFVLGLDCEWQPSWEKGNRVNPIDVIQLSSSKTTAVIHLSVLQKGHKVMPPALEKLLTNKEITKIVVDKVDVDRLYDEYKIKVNHLDIQKMPISYRIGTISLSGMSEIFFKQRLSKTQGRTNWARRTLTKHQIVYAALDAEMTRRIYFFIKDLPLD